MGSIPPDSRPDFMTQVRRPRQGRAHRAAHRPRLGGARARPIRPRPRDRVAVRHDCRDALCLCEHGRAGSGPAGVRSANARRLSWHDERICLQACHRADERVGSSARSVLWSWWPASLKSYECMTRACGRSSRCLKWPFACVQYSLVVGLKTQTTTKDPNKYGRPGTAALLAHNPAHRHAAS